MKRFGRFDIVVLLGMLLIFSCGIGLLNGMPNPTVASPG